MKFTEENPFQETTMTETLEPTSPPQIGESFFQNLQQECSPYHAPTPPAPPLMTLYKEEAAKRGALDHNFFLVLQGWNEESREALPLPSALKRFLLPESQQRTTGGFYLRWNNKGIVINPGLHFLENFHKAHLHVRDIDIVLVTHNAHECYADVQGIYELNYQQNLLFPQLHTIQYYVHQGAYHHCVSTLKPHFKQERNTLHSLQFYLDSAEKETVSLTDDIQLHYFSPNGLNPHLSACLELASPNTSPLTVGWALEKNAQKKCDLLLTANTSVSEEMAKFVLCCDFEGKEGDHRLEGVKKMRQAHPQLTVLPGDTGLRLSLPHFSMPCSLCHQQTAPSQMRVVKSAPAFGQLHYLCPNCAL